jgi:hypothetical protein
VTANLSFCVCHGKIHPESYEEHQVGHRNDGTGARGESDKTLSVLAIVEQFPAEEAGFSALHISHFYNKEDYQQGDQ